MGDDDKDIGVVTEGSAEPASSLELGRDFFSTGGCWSTGKNWHSLRNRIQFSHRPWASSAATKQRIFRRRQCTVRMYELDWNYIVWVAAYSIQLSCCPLFVCAFETRDNASGHVKMAHKRVL